MIARSLWESALELQGFLKAEQLRFAFIGGLAVQRWGEPRMTDDIDVTVVVPFGEEVNLAKKVIRRYQSRYPKPLEFVLQARILLLQDISGYEIDMSVGGLVYEDRLVERATEWEIPGGGSLRTCSAEDLVILKCFADRPIDWIDVRSVIKRQRDELDSPTVLSELAMLAELKEAPELVDQLKRELGKY